VLEELVPDGLWEQVAPLLPPPEPRRHRHPVGGRSTIGPRRPGSWSCSKTGIAWNQLPMSGPLGTLFSLSW
jgi:hypothetical protein